MSYIREWGRRRVKKKKLFRTSRHSQWNRSSRRKDNGLYYAPLLFVISNYNQSAV